MKLIAVTAIALVSSAGWPTATAATGRGNHNPRRAADKCDTYATEGSEMCSGFHAYTVDGDGNIECNSECTGGIVNIDESPKMTGDDIEKLPIKFCSLTCPDASSGGSAEEEEMIVDTSTAARALIVASSLLVINAAVFVSLL